MKYILRFCEEHYIKTLRFIDYDSMKYVRDKLDMKGITYVLIVENEENNKKDKNKFELSVLLDLKDLDEYKNTLVENIYID